MQRSLLGIGVLSPKLKAFIAHKRSPSSRDNGNNVRELDYHTRSNLLEALSCTKCDTNLERPFREDESGELGRCCKIRVRALTATSGRWMALRAYQMNYYHTEGSGFSRCT